MRLVKSYELLEEKAIDEAIIENTTTINNKKVKMYIEKIIKRFVDIIMGLIGTLILIPVTIGIFIARKILHEDDGPIFYEQLRIGKDGKVFRMYKYRSMVIGADEKLSTYLKENEEARKEYSKYKKLKNDPRITKVGKFIRKTSIDEFPQFINVLLGQMSLVGPRPYLPREQEDMGNYYKYIIQCKPGITGYWQTSGRSGVTFDDRLKMDYKYCQKRSLKVDAKLLMKTILNVVKKEGAI